MKTFLYTAHTAIIVLLGTLIAVFLVKRNLLKRFPIFSCYIAYSTLDTLARVLVLWWKGESVYFGIYWYLEAGEVVLALWAMLESLFAIFAGFERFRWFRTLVWLSACVALSYGFLKAIAQPPLAGPFIMSLVISTELLFQYWLMSTGVLFFALMLVLEVPLQQRECWIIFGFLVESLLIVTGFLLRSVFGTRFLLASTVLPAISYILGKSIWAVGTARKEEAFYAIPKIDGLNLQTMISILDRQIDLLKQFLRWRPGRE